MGYFDPSLEGLNALKQGCKSLDIFLGHRQSRSFDIQTQCKDKILNTMFGFPCSEFPDMS